jgi:hypothetical protein
MALLRLGLDPAPMKKRVFATILWFYAGWYAGAMVAELFGLSAALGPIFGTAAAAIVGGDPRHLIWGKPVKPAAEASSPDAAASAPAPNAEPAQI